ncbi:hypothetical protein Tco_0853419, partial [Tanacetum coccineum]
MATCDHLSDATWHDNCSGTVTEATVGPSVNGGQRRSTMASDGQRVLEPPRTTAGTTSQPPSMVVGRLPLYHLSGGHVDTRLIILTPKARPGDRTSDLVVSNLNEDQETNY